MSEPRQAKFTPGDWQLEVWDDEGDEKSIFIRSEDGVDTIAEVIVGYVGLEEAIANGQLMVSAKDLYAACKAVSEAFDTLPNECMHGPDCEKCKAVAQARAALKKAVGE